LFEQNAGLADSIYFGTLEFNQNDCNMPTFPTNFEPSKESMHKWFGTRKKPMVFGAVELPGVFQTHAYSSDTLRIAIVIVLELIGAFAVMSAGGFSLRATVPILFAIIVDVFLAIQLHSFLPQRLANKNQAKATDDPALAKRFDELSKKGKLLEWIYSFLIVLIGLIKGLGYIILVRGPEPQAILMFFIFFIIAILHITTTGFWFAEFNLRNSISKEVKENVLSLGQKYAAKERISSFTSDVPITVINIARHRLIRVENSNQYQIITLGVLTDHELASMVAVQPNVMLQSAVATACIKHQIQNILLG